MRRRALVLRDHRAVVDVAVLDLGAGGGGWWAKAGRNLSAGGGLRAPAQPGQGAGAAQQRVQPLRTSQGTPMTEAGAPFRRSPVAHLLTK